ncbi:hypothetical protein Vafri_20282, partial [Volvox africanus]
MKGPGLNSRATCRACLEMEPRDPVGDLLRSSNPLQHPLAEFSVNEVQIHRGWCRREVVSHRIVISYPIDLPEFEEESFEEGEQEESHGGEGLSTSAAPSCRAWTARKCAGQDEDLAKVVREYSLVAEAAGASNGVAAVVATVSSEGHGNEEEKHEEAMTALRVETETPAATPISAMYGYSADVADVMLKGNTRFHGPGLQNQFTKLLHQQRPQTPPETSETRYSSRSEPKSQIPSLSNGETERLIRSGVISRRLRSVAFAIDRDETGFTAFKRLPRRQQPVCVRLPLSRMELLEKSGQGSSVFWRQLQQDFPAQLGGQLRQCG